MDTNTTAIVLALIAAIIVPVITASIKWLQDKRIAKLQEIRDEKAASLVVQVAEKVEETKATLMASTANTDAKLDTIHVLVNNQLTEAVNRFKDALAVIEELKVILNKIAPDDPRVKELIKLTK
jgi:hypothetical protein